MPQVIYLHLESLPLLLQWTLISYVCLFQYIYSMLETKCLNTIVYGGKPLLPDDNYDPNFYLLNLRKWDLCSSSTLFV